MFNKTFFVALVLCACFFSATLARPQLGGSGLPNPGAILTTATGLAAPVSGTALGATGIASSLAGAAMPALGQTKVL